MKHGVDNPGWARDYLLGRLAEIERAQVEERSLTHSSAFEELLAVEDDLIDDYVLGRLSWRDKRAFDREYFTTRERREKVEMARALLAHVNAHGALSPPRRWLGLLHWRIATACALALAIASAWWGLRQRAITPVQHAITDAPKVRQAASVVAFTLVPGAERDTGSARVLRVPAGTDEIELRAPVEIAGHLAFDAELRTPEGRVAWIGKDLHMDSGGILSMRIPAPPIDPGDYLLSIVSSDPPRNEAGVFSFRVVRD